MFSTVLVANRGEIAVRIVRTLRRLGIRSAAVYSDADADARHVREADIAIAIGPSAAQHSYLSIERIMQAAEGANADALHPGYGFLAENARLAEACRSGGITFIGPPATAILAMGDKIESKRMVAAAGVPVVPWVDGRGLSEADIVQATQALGFPILIKPSAGGGGKGMRLVNDAAALSAELTVARREALNAFGDDALLLERYLERPRHIEIQIAADMFGDIVHLGERECSLQRRHQKIIEEAPSPFVSPAMRSAMGAQAIAAARACGYHNVGTVEFIVPHDSTGEFFFMEMNTRLQVEHPVTEMVWGVDLVELQLRLAASERLADQSMPTGTDGHAVEARVYAEDPGHGFLPTGGTILSLREPSGPGIRVDSGVQAGSVVGSQYDPMLAKVIAHGPTRQVALARLDAALASYPVLGLATNISHLRSLLSAPEVIEGHLDTTLVERLVERFDPPEIDPAALAASTLVIAGADRREPVGSAWDSSFGWRNGGATPATYRLRVDHDRVVTTTARCVDGAWLLTIDGAPETTASVGWDADRLRCRYADRVITFDAATAADGSLWIGLGGQTWHLETLAARRADRAEKAGSAGPVLSPMPGTLLAVHVAEGDMVIAGQALAIVEAMKMEHVVRASAAGIVTVVHAAAGKQLQMYEPILAIESVKGTEP